MPTFDTIFKNLSIVTTIKIIHNTCLPEERDIVFCLFILKEIGEDPKKNIVPHSGSTRDWTTSLIGIKKSS